jgi:quaternary ammonium compound-resistance protein SugE
VGYVIAASVAFGLGGALMRISGGWSDVWPTLGVLACFAAGALLLGRAVSIEGLTVAYVAGLGIEALVSVCLGRYVFHEAVSPVQLAGIALIAVGIATVQFG